MKHHHPITVSAAVVSLALLAAAALAAPTTKSTQEPAFDLMERLYKPLTRDGDDLGWPMKVEMAASGSELKFSTSTREVFYTWAKSTCADWLGDRKAYVACHGDLHLGNLGSYLVDVQSQQMALGLKDFDESASMPFQTDLLQAMVSLRLGVKASGWELNEATAAKAARELMASYRESMESGRTATEALGNDPRLEKLMAVKGSLRDEVDKWVGGDHFRPTLSKKGELREILRPALRGDDEQDAARFTKTTLAIALSQAMGNSPSLSAVCVAQTAKQWEEVIGSAAFRTRLGSGGSQGMTKLLIHVQAGVKLAGGTSDAIFYLKQQDQSAGQRAGYAPPLDLNGAQRVTAAEGSLTSPQIGQESWCELGGKTFLVSIMNPWDDEPKEDIKDEAQLLWAARVYGLMLGAAHRSASHGGEEIRTRLTGLEQKLVARSAAFATFNAAQFKAFKADPRVAELEARAKAAVAAASK